MRHSFTRHHHALLQCLTSVQADPLHYLKICAVPLAPFAHIVRPRNGQLNIIVRQKSTRSASLRNFLLAAGLLTG
jgi:hypothetical protein